MSHPLSSFIWAAVDIMRGDLKQSQYGSVILPFTVLRRIECILSTDTVCQLDINNSTLLKLSDIEQKEALKVINNYVDGFCDNVKDIFIKFNFSETLKSLDANGLLHPIIRHFSDVDMSIENVSNQDMGVVFEDMIHRFAEMAGETAGEFYTPGDLVKLVTTLCVRDGCDGDVSIYDPTCGVGGMLSGAMELMLGTPRVFGQELNPESYAICKADMLLKGQDVSRIKLGNTLSNDHLSDAKFDYMLSNPPFGVDWKKIDGVINAEFKRGFAGRFGAGLPRVSDGSLLFLQHLISKMHDDIESRIAIILNGSPLFTGGAGSGESEIRRHILESDLLECIVALPTDMFYNTGISTYIWLLTNRKHPERRGKVQLIDASNLHSKMRKSLGSKRNLMSDDHINLIANTYRDFAATPHTPLYELGLEPVPEKKAKLGKKEAPKTFASKIFSSTDFGFRRITVERPLRLSFYPHDESSRAGMLEDKDWPKVSNSEDLIAALDAMDEKHLSRDAFINALPFKPAPVVLKMLIKHLGKSDPGAEICITKGQIESDSNLRDNENVPLGESIEGYFAREVLPHVPDAWINTDKRDTKDNEVGIVGYEIPFNRHFYVYQPPRDLKDIDADLEKIQREIMALMNEMNPASTHEVKKKNKRQHDNDNQLSMF